MVPLLKGDMKITVVAVTCHRSAPPSLSRPTPHRIPSCREVIFIKDDMSMQSCMLSQPALAEWKDRSIHRGASWWISRIKCVPADYVPKERV
jgi:hypothetical protein